MKFTKQRDHALVILAAGPRRGVAVYESNYTSELAGNDHDPLAVHWRLARWLVDEQLATVGRDVTGRWRLELTDVGASVAAHR